MLFIVIQGILYLYFDRPLKRDWGKDVQQRSSRLEVKLPTTPKYGAF